MIAIDSWHRSSTVYIANSRTQIAPATRVSVAATDNPYAQLIPAMAEMSVRCRLSD
jgi:hypothetical protein